MYFHHLQLVPTPFHMALNCSTSFLCGSHMANIGCRAQTIHTEYVPHSWTCMKYREMMWGGSGPYEKVSELIEGDGNTFSHASKMFHMGSTRFTMNRLTSAATLGHV
jgi:hypothetical protein